MGVAMPAQSIKLKIMEMNLLREKWKKICAATAVIAFGLACGVLLWQATLSRLMPDLSEQPSVASYYASRTGR